MESVAFFVSPHGFGHAARSCAVIDALVRRDRSRRFHIFTTVPQWFFAESLPDCFEYHSCVTDIGLVQRSPLEEDLEATQHALAAAPWRDDDLVETLARRLRHLNCALVVADISPLGLCVARRAGLCSVLVENFTWDWIYSHIEGAPGLASHCDELAAINAMADLRIQASPACRQVQTAVQVGPVARPPRSSRIATRGRLGIPEGSSLVLASMGGLGWNDTPLDTLAGEEPIWIAVPGGADVETRRARSVLLPFHSSYYHPDLVGAADVVVGKLGYSTVVEAARAGTAFAFVERPRFPESPVLASFVEHHLTAARIQVRDFADGNWMPVVRRLLARERKCLVVEDGAVRAAEAITERFPEIFGSRLNRAR